MSKSNVSSFVQRGAILCFKTLLNLHCISHFEELKTKDAYNRMTWGVGASSAAALTLLRTIKIWNLLQNHLSFCEQFEMILFTEKIRFVVSCKMQIILCSMMTAMLSRGELVVNRENSGLTTVPRDINAEATTLILNRNFVTRLENDSLNYLLFLEKLYMDLNGIAYIGRFALEKNICLYLLSMYAHKLPVFPTHFGGASYRIEFLSLAVWAHDMESIQLLNFSRLRMISMNQNKIQTGNLIMKSLPALIELYAPSCNLHVFPNLSAAPALKYVQLHFNYFNEIPAYALKNLSRLRRLGCAFCHLTYLPDMSHLIKLQQLIINSNKLIAIPDLYQLPLKKISWAGNPLHCDKSLCWVRMWNSAKPKDLKLDVYLCASPPDVSGIRLTDIHPVEMKCYEG